MVAFQFKPHQTCTATTFSQRLLRTSSPTREFHGWRRRNVPYLIGRHTRSRSFTSLTLPLLVAHSRVELQESVCHLSCEIAHDGLQMATDEQLTSQEDTRLTNFRAQWTPPGGSQYNHSAGNSLTNSTRPSRVPAHCATKPLLT